jgi:hypothetical protein
MDIFETSKCFSSFSVKKGKVDPTELHSEEFQIKELLVYLPM